MKYKQAIKDKERASQHQFSDALNDALLQKDANTFWRRWRSKVGKKGTSEVTDGLTDNADIANRFASIFKNACIPNSESRHNELFSEFLTAFNNYHCKTELDVNVAVVNACVSKLKCVKLLAMMGYVLSMSLMPIHC